jgi:hypothetical protein
VVISLKNPHATLVEEFLNRREEALRKWHCMTALVLALASSAAFAKCKPVVGHFEAQVVPPGHAAVLHRGPGVGRHPAQLPVRDERPHAVVGTDTGAIDLPPGQGGFASLITFTGGTGGMSGATGQIRLRGEFDVASGTTSGDYLGSLCTP